MKSTVLALGPGLGSGHLRPKDMAVRSHYQPGADNRLSCRVAPRPQRRRRDSTL